MTETNKEYKFAVLDTMATVVKQIVIGINNDLQNPKNIELFHKIGRRTWKILQQQTYYDSKKPEQKNKYSGSVISIVKILGILSPLILSINGKADLKRFFIKLLQICGRKALRAFQSLDSGGMANKVHVMKYILYNQKELTSFIGSFAKIIEQL